MLTSIITCSQVSNLIFPVLQRKGCRYKIMKLQNWNSEASQVVTSEAEAGICRTWPGRSYSLSPYYRLLAVANTRQLRLYLKETIWKNKDLGTACLLVLPAASRAVVQLDPAPVWLAGTQVLPSQAREAEVSWDSNWQFCRQCWPCRQCFNLLCQNPRPLTSIKCYLPYSGALCNFQRHGLRLGLA